MKILRKIKTVLDNIAEALLESHIAQLKAKERAMSNLEKARRALKIEQDKMQGLLESPFPGLQIQVSAAAIRHIFSALKPEDRAILYEEETNKLNGVTK